MVELHCWWQVLTRKNKSHNTKKCHSMLCNAKSVEFYMLKKACKIWLWCQQLHRAHYLFSVMCPSDELRLMVSLFALVLSINSGLHGLLGERARMKTVRVLRWGQKLWISSLNVKHKRNLLCKMSIFFFFLGLTDPSRTASDPNISASHVSAVSQHHTCQKAPL